MKKILLVLLFLILLSNMPFLNFFVQDTYTYANEDNTFIYTEEQGKGKSYWGAQRQFGRFLCQNPEKESGSNLLFRTFSIKPWRFWEWRELIFHSDRFKLPYKDPNEKHVQ